MPETLKELREIFFESSSRKDFKDEAEREAFYWKYMGHYLTHYPELLVTIGEERILGYCLGAPHTSDPELLGLQPHLKLFTDLYSDFPAHLHINCHADARGQGVGGKLLQDFEKKLQELGITGVHLITSPDARNRSFYTRRGYSVEHVRMLDGRPLLFMGKRL